MSGTGRGNLGEVRDKSGNPRGGPGRVGGVVTGLLIICFTLYGLHVIL